MTLYILHHSVYLDYLKLNPSIDSKGSLLKWKIYKKAGFMTKATNHIFDCHQWTHDPFFKDQNVFPVIYRQSKTTFDRNVILVNINGPMDHYQESRCHSCLWWTLWTIFICPFFNESFPLFPDKSVYLLCSICSQSLSYEPYVGFVVKGQSTNFNWIINPAKTYSLNGLS